VRPLRIATPAAPAAQRIATPAAPATLRIAALPERATQPFVHLS
jgi:hypothetical protein